MSVPTLFTLAAHILGTLKYSPKVIKTFVPKEVNEQLVLFMKGCELCDYVKSFGGIYNIYKTFSIDGFQRFYLHFLQMCEKTNFLETRNKMKLQKDDFIVTMIYDLRNDDTEIDLNFCFRSMGFPDIFFDFKEPRFQYYFFSCKFHTYHLPYDHFPVPAIPPNWTQFLPTNVDTSVLPFLIQPLRLKRDPPFQQFTLNDEFFVRLLAMVNAYTRDRHHETLAYGFELVAHQTIYQNNVLNKYYVYVYGMLAVTLSELHIEFDICSSFLVEAEHLAKICSQTLDIFYYKMRVAKNFYMFDLVHEMFFKIFDVVPMESNFYPYSLQIYFNALFVLVENNLCKALVYNHHFNEEHKKKCRSILLETRVILKRHRKFIYKCLSTDQKEEADFELYNLIIEMYMLCIDKLSTTINYFINDQLTCLALQLDRVSRLYYFFKHLCSPFAFSVDMLMHKLETILVCQEKCCHIKFCEENGNLTFTYFLLFQIFTNKQDVALQLLEKAMECFKFNASPRYQMGLHFKQKNVNFTDDSHSFKTHPINIPRLLQTHGRIGKALKLGVISIEEYNKRHF